MVDNMRKVILISFLLILSVSNVFAQYKRKLKEPDFFIPYNDRMHKPEVLPKLKNIANTAHKTVKNNKKDDVFFEETPEYKKIYDDYFNTIKNFMLTKKFEENGSLDNDLSMMISGDVFEVTEDTLSNITTQEQYDFYMLAKNILDN